jgi:hypothetical protein
MIIPKPEKEGEKLPASIRSCKKYPAETMLMQMTAGYMRKI